MEKDATVARTNEARSIAEGFARRIATAFPAVEAVCLFGSIARGDATAKSDIDILVLGSDSALTPTKLLKGERARDRDRLSVMYYTTREFLEHYAERALFVAHILREGQVLMDRTGLLGRLLNTEYRPVVDADAAISRELEKLRLYEAPGRFHGNYLFCLSHLFAIGKSIVMLRLAQAGIFEFDKVKALAEFKHLYPKHAAEAATVEKLLPYYRLTTRSEQLSGFDDYKGSQALVRQAISAIRSLGGATNA